MKRPVLWSRAALNDARDQAVFIALENPSAAHRIADEIRSAGDALGEIALGRPGHVSGIYEKSVTGLPYVIAYTIDARADGETLVIVRVIHTARDWPEDDWPRDD